MTIAKIVAIVGILAMTAVLVYGFVIGDFGAEGAQLLSMPWGIVSLVDLYVGFALFSCWIAYRERSPWVAVIWIVLMMILGFWTGAVYTALALFTAGGDPHRALLGHRADRG
jgi:hypothetical protein